LYSIENITEFISSLLRNKEEESLILEYKASRELDDFSKKQLDKLSVVVSSFANTYGGVLIYGMDTKRRKAHKPSGFETHFSKDKAKQLYMALNTRIFRNIKNLKIHTPVIENHQLLVFEIPESRQAPHIAFDKRYYKRHNYKEVVMEEYDIRMLYNKTNISELEFFGINNTNGIPNLINGNYNSMGFFPRFMIRNASSSVEKFYKLEIALPNNLVDTNYSNFQQYFTRHDGSYAVYSIPGKYPLFQEEIATIIEAKLIVTENNFDEFEDGQVQIKLFFSNGISQNEYRLIETFRYKNIMLKSSDFKKLSE